MSDDSYSDDSFEDSQDLSADAVPRKPEPEDVGSETETPGSASTSKFSPLRANAASSLPSPPPPQSDAQVISRLKVSNTKLRNQLTEFNEILRNTLKDASLKGAGKGAGTGAGSGSPPEKTAPHAFIQLKETQIKAARERRRQSRISEDGGDDAASVLRATELPSNHPFATSEAVDGDLSAKQAAKIREMNKPRARGRGAAGRKDR